MLSCRLRCLRVGTLVVVVFISFDFGVTFADVTTQNRKAQFQRSYNFLDLKVLTDMFADCETFIVSYGGLPSNVHEVSQPLQLYNKHRHFKKRGISIKSAKAEDLMIYHTAKTELFRQELKSRHCKAQILIFHTPILLKKAHSLNSFSGLRPGQSTYRYTVVIHNTEHELEGKLFQWVDPIATVSVHHFYHVKMKCAVKRRIQAMKTKSLLGIHHMQAHYRGTMRCRLDDFKPACLYCKRDSVLEHPCQLDHPKKCALKLASHCQSVGSIVANEQRLSLIHRNPHVYVSHLIFEFGAFDEVAEKANGRTSYRQLIQEVKTGSRRHEVFTNLNVLLFPEEIFLDSILSHHENATVEYSYSPSEKSEPEFWYGAKIGYEVITGPGFPMPSFEALEYAPVGTAGVSFMTCSNVSFVPRTGIFFAPFDATTWIWGFATVIAVSITLILATKRIKVFPALFMLLYAMIRMLLENFHDVNKGVVKHEKLMAALTFFMGLATIILSNVYRGVLTSDLAMAPDIVGVPSFEQILASNWTVALHNSYSILAIQKIPKEVISIMIYRILFTLTIWIHSTDHAHKAHEFELDGRVLQDLELAVEAYSKLSSAIPPVDVYDSVNNSFDCNGSYWLFQTGTFSNTMLPEECKNSTISRKFLLSDESIVNMMVTWASASNRPGPIYNSIRQLIEAGAYKWLNKIRRASNTALYVENNVIKVTLREDPKPLTMATVLVASTFRVHFVLCSLALAILLAEISWWKRQPVSFKVRYWMSKLSGSRFWQSLKQCERLC